MEKIGILRFLAVVACCYCSGVTVTSFAAPAGKPVVAVLPFSSPTEYSAMGRNAQETFVTQLVKSRQLRVIQAPMVSRMLKQHGMAFSGVLETAMVNAMSRWMKADFVLAGKMTWGGDAFIFSVHVIDMRSLETVLAEEQDFRDASKMRIATRSLAKRMIGVILSGGADAPEDENKSAMFLNIDAKAFYDTADACIAVLERMLENFDFTGTIDTVEEDQKMVTVKGFANHLKEGVPLDVYSTSGIGEPSKITTVWVSRVTSGGFEAKFKKLPSDGIELGAQVTTDKHKWRVVVGRIEDEAEDNEKLVQKFREALVEKFNETDSFDPVSKDGGDIVGKTALKKLADRGIDLFIDGKFYGSVGDRRAHFKVYSTATGKVWFEPKFDTSL